MTIRTSNQAIAKAKGQTRNVPGTCQINVRTWFAAPSAGDQDRDGDADAVDGWLSEPRAARHPGDRNPPLGKPLSFKGGRNGYGHRALSGYKSVFSTDMYNNRYRAGYTSRVTGTSVSDAIAKIERSMGVTYVGWSETIDGYRIPKEPVVATSSTSTPRPEKVPTRWRRFKHLDPNRYMNYHQALLHLSAGQALDVDGRSSKQGTGWALHWATVGKNHLHDPKKLIKSTRRIDSLTDAEIGRLRGPNNEEPFKIVHLLREAHDRKVRIELELKIRFPTATVKKWLSYPKIKALHKAGRLQFKTLAATSGAPGRLKPAHDAGGVTILSFTKYDGPGVYKRNAWPVTDYVRGTAKWR